MKKKINWIFNYFDINKNMLYYEYGYLGIYI